MARILEFLDDDIYTMHAREEALTRARGNTLSFSKLTGPSISIGRLQNYKDVIEDRVLKDKVAVTRRKTGGRFMYLDENDVIVSFALSNDDSIRKNYDSICNIIVRSLSEITGEEFYIANLNDIMHESGRKIGGAAQSRNDKEGTSMIHVYIRHSVNPDTLFRYCALDGYFLEDHVKVLARHITSVSDINPNLTFSKFYSIFYNKVGERFESLIGEDASESQLTNYEIQKINELRETYTNSAYIIGDSDYPSRGHCDAIAGTGSNSVLKIPALEGRVRYG